MFSNYLDTFFEEFWKLKSKPPEDKALIGPISLASPSYYSSQLTVFVPLPGNMAPLSIKKPHSHTGHS